MKRLFSVVSIAVASLLATSTWANLITNGDFESSLTGLGEFNIGSNLNQWVQFAGQYELRSGPSGLYAAHTADSNQNDHKLVQFISGAGLADSTVELFYDYIYEGGYPGYISIFGVASNRTCYMYGGSGADCAYNGGSDYTVESPDKLLAQVMLNQSSTWMVNQSISALIDMNYFAIGVMIQSGCNSYEDCVGTLAPRSRGFDNFSLNQVPAPATLALFGLGLAGLGWSRRKKV